MLSRSPKRSLVINWWCVGTMPVCRLDAVSASSCSRFSRRCSSKIFCNETRLYYSPWHFHSFVHTFIITHYTCIFQSRFCQSRFLNFDILTSLSPWRLRNTSSGLSPCAGDKSRTETKDENTVRTSSLSQSCCIMHHDIKINASNNKSILIQCMLYSTLQQKHTHIQKVECVPTCIYGWTQNDQCVFMTKEVPWPKKDTFIGVWTWLY